jgi:hypothetical protein
MPQDQPMTPEEFATKMRGFFNVAEFSEPERARADAVRVMCEILEAQGYGEGVRVYRQIVIQFL